MVVTQGLQTESAPGERQGAPAARVEVTGHSSRLFIGGTLPHGWAGKLALGLSRRQISILRGCACRVNRGGWSAYFDLHRLKGAPALDAIDYCALAAQDDPQATRAAIDLERFTLIPMLGGGLQLEVRGRDCVGFLGSLLDRLAALSLFPEEMQIETIGHVAEDRFQLRGAGGRAVSEETRRALEGLLTFWRRPPPSRSVW